MAKFQVDLLDVGAIEYGDSVLIQAGGLTALIDGGKSASGNSSSSVVLGETVSHKPLDVQIRELLGGTTVDLLVVTHCHSDHVGCLPRLFAEGRLSCKYALLADAQLGYGIGVDAPLLPDFSEMAPKHKLQLALHEEPITSSDPAAIRAFIEDSAREYSDYLRFGKSIKTALGDQCVEYRGTLEQQSPGLTALLTAMAPMGLRIYGPSLTHLIRCAGFLEGRSEDMPEEELQEAIRKNNGDLAAAYRSLQPIPLDADLAGDGEGDNGNAVNNQSIVMSVSDGVNRVLLTGDMQFVKPQVADEELKAEMKQLIERVAADAPFAFVKLSHHGATNGQNLTFLRKLGARNFGISTGSRSGKHPTDATLDALKALAMETPIQWGRVDINGKCQYSGTGGLTVSRKTLNDSTPAALRAGDAVEIPPAATVQPQPSAPMPTHRLVAAGGSDGVEVVVRIPRGVARVNVTIEVTESPL